MFIVFLKINIVVENLAEINTNAYFLVCCMRVELERYW